MSKGKMTFYLFLSFLATFAFLSTQTRLAAQMSTITVGDLGISGGGPMYIGIEKGYFKEQGVELKLERFAGAGPAMAPLAANKIQTFVAGGITEGLFNAAARGLPIVVVGSTAQVLPKWEGSVMVLRTDLKDQVRSPADLKGRKVAINTRSSPFFYVLGKILETGGLKMEDIELVTMPWPDYLAAFTRKAIDAGLVTEPFITANVGRGLAVRWVELPDLIKDPYIQISVIFMNRDWGKKNPELAGKFLLGWIKGARDYHRFVSAGVNKSEIIDIFTKYTALKDRSLYDRMRFNYVNPNGFADVRSIDDQQNWYHAKGLVATKVPMEQLVDHSYVRWALEKIGEFKE